MNLLELLSAAYPDSLPAEELAARRGLSLERLGGQLSRLAESGLIAVSGRGDVRLTDLGLSRILGTAGAEPH